ncbi:MAG: prepilin peptidase [Pirellulales bacterium]
MSALAQVLAEFPIEWDIWTFLIGTAVGSFLNVVVYRALRGRSLTHPGSRCPKCDHPIRPWHNIPLLGWLLLAGKCRDCRAPISPRYPLVECVVGLVWMLLGALTTIQLPLTIELVDGQGEIVDYALGTQNIVVWIARSILATTLIGAVLIRYDRQTMPFGLIVVGLLAAATAVLTFPDDPYLWFTLLIAAMVGLSALNFRRSSAVPDSDDARTRAHRKRRAGHHAETPRE